MVQELRRVNLLRPEIGFCFGGTWTRQRDVVKAWIAVGDTSVAVIFAFGGIAIAPICVGGFAIGGVVFGGFGAGVLY